MIICVKKIADQNKCPIIKPPWENIINPGGEGGDLFFFLNSYYLIITNLVSTKQHQWEFCHDAVE